MPIRIPSTATASLCPVGCADRKEVGDDEDEVEVVKIHSRLDDRLLEEFVIASADAQDPADWDVVGETPAQARCQKELPLADLCVLIDQGCPQISVELGGQNPVGVLRVGGKEEPHRTVRQNEAQKKNRRPLTPPNPNAAPTKKQKPRGS